MLAEPLHDAHHVLPKVVVDGAAVFVGQIDRVDELAVDVELKLPMRSIADPDLKNLRDIATIEETPSRQVRDRRGWLLAGAVFTVVISAGLVWIARCRLSRPVAGMTLEQRGLAALERLERRGLIERGRTERFAALLTTLLRRYLGQRARA